MNYENEELKLVDIQMILSGLFILTVLLSLTVNYNNHLKLSGQQTFLTEEEAKNLIIVTKILALISALGFLFISIKGAELFNEESKGSDSKLEVGASILVVIATIIVLYVALKEGTDTLIAPENPEI